VKSVGQTTVVVQSTLQNHLVFLSTEACDSSSNLSSTSPQRLPPTCCFQSPLFVTMCVNIVTLRENGFSNVMKLLQ